MIMNGKQNERRIRAKERLEIQLKQGKKPTKEGLVSLEDKDVARIKREIESLANKIR